MMRKRTSEENAASRSSNIDNLTFDPSEPPPPFDSPAFRQKAVEIILRALAGTSSRSGCGSASEH
jgi:hypothetical protein